jgi:hypothetical protein
METISLLNLTSEYNLITRLAEKSQQEVDESEGIQTDVKLLH